ncbi:MAG TPA: hypothetical protein VMQ52_01585 [Candidatus Saccharimonadales bacterium]|jgi:glycosyltransferase involved in cell wall biosynthesis|nr:hypothetical protein [Candidatus Saccharimonadales bacterium]
MAKSLKLVARTKKAKQILKEKGLIEVMIAVLVKIQKEITRASGTRAKKRGLKLLVKEEDILSTNWVTNPYKPIKTKSSPPYIINWVMSPPRKGGGHQNIFRFIKFLEDKGYTNRVYLYSAHDYATVRELKNGMQGSYPDTRAPIKWLNGPMKPADAVFATGWETAYPVFRDTNNSHKLYFVQDFEPYFYPVGSEYVLAENTYKFNFFGVTAGKWLSDKLQSEYGMKCASYDFGADKELYKFTNSGKRNKVFFYARPVTARRGFELGLLTLEKFHQQLPDYEILCAGWDISEYNVTFPYKNLKNMTLPELSDVYNQCAAALVISLTNMSLMPLELLAAGAIPVVTDGPNNRKVSSNSFIKYAETSPDALAAALVDVVTMKDLPKYAKQASESVNIASWDVAGEKLVRILEDELNG